MPDLDNVGVLFGAYDLDLWFGGHRGFTHSIFFALLVGAACAALLNRNPDHLLRYWLGFAAATASHGVLDAFSAQGPAVGFFSPFSAARFTFGWHTLDPSGSAAGQVGFPAKLAAVAGNELLWVGVPCLMLVAATRVLRRARPSMTGAVH